MNFTLLVDRLAADAQQQVLDGTLNLTAVTWCRFAASLAAFAALAWLDFTLLFFGGILQVTSGSTGPPCVAGVTSHTVATQLRMMCLRRQSNRTVLHQKRKFMRTSRF